MGYLLRYKVSSYELNPYLIRTIMKNVFKFGFLALAISLSIAACSSDKTADSTDSTMVDTSMTGMDTTATDTMATDTMMKDTMQR